MNELYPMSLSPERQYEIIAIALFAGLLAGSVYDLLRALRSGFGTGRITENVTDFFYVLFFFGAFFVLSVARTGGARLFVLGAMLLGLIAERFSSGRLIVFLLSPVFSLFKRAVLKAAKPLYDKIKQKVKIVFVKNKSKSEKFSKISKKDLKLCGKRVYNTEE